MRADINSDHVLLIDEVDIRLKKVRGRQVTKKFDMEKGHSMKRCIQISAEETIWYKESKNVKKRFVTGKMLDKLEGRRKWKNINTEEAKRIYRKVNNELRRETNKAKEEWMKQKCEEIEELERKWRYDLTYREVKSLDYGKKSRKAILVIEDENSEEITGKQGTLNKWEKYVEELYATRNRPTIMDIENEITISED